MPGEIESETRGVRLPAGRRLALESNPIDSNIVPKPRWTVSEDSVMALALGLTGTGISMVFFFKSVEGFAFIMGGSLIFYLAAMNLPAGPLEQEHPECEPEKKPHA